MKFKNIILIIALVIPLITFSAARDLTIQDIPKVMNKLLKYHIESDEINSKIVKRWFKLYIEQFDPAKIYLTKVEVLPYLKIGEKKIEEIIERVKHEDFSDFFTLNTLIQKGIRRSRGWRKDLYEQIITEKGVARSLERVDYAQTEKELQDRQKENFGSFFFLQETNTMEERTRVMEFLERKLQRIEDSFLSEREHFFSLYILKAFAKSLDAHTTFFSEKEAMEMRRSLEKEYEGVGLVLVESLNGTMVVDLIEKSPAKKCGLIKIKDILVEVNGRSMDLVPFEDVLEALKGRANSQLTLGFKRLNSKEFFRVELTRQRLTLEDERLTYATYPFGDGAIAHITLSSFYENGNEVSSEKDLKRVIRSLKRESSLKGIILDLRNNGGGFLTQAVQVASLFMNCGVVVIAKYVDGDVRYFRKIGGKAYFSGPLIILVSKLSASASEIVAQALQDYGVAIIVGDERTFGKSSIQYQTVTDEKADIFFKVTVGRYYTVSGKSTQIDGVLADIVVPSKMSAYKIGERFLTYPLSADHIEGAFKDTLEDIEPRLRSWLKKNYLPNLQRYIPFWKRFIPLLKENSQKRLVENRNFQVFLQQQQLIQEEADDLNVKELEGKMSCKDEDLQMQEAINILKDMILLEAQSYQSLRLN